ncbi:DNA recombination-mediator protein A [Actinobacteria bacterium IMCC26256]|nr:DNA recombination-mediator protein A [Actinobacteria bacterium IMCC26256]
MTLFEVERPENDGTLNLKTAAGLQELLNLRGVGPKKAVDLASAFGTWGRLVHATEAELVAVLGNSKDKENGWNVPTEPGGTPGDLPHGVRLIGFFDDDFPDRLRTIPSPPALLWVRGTLPQGLTLAVVGTRNPTRYGRVVVDEVCKWAGETGVGIVSGLALGIDAAAHEKALEWGCKTWAILGSGVDVPSPPANVGLAERILEAGGGLIAEVKCGTAPEPRHLVARDRLQSGIANATVIAQAGVPSGTLHTARFTLEQGRPLIVGRPRPSNEFEVQSEANYALTDPKGLSLPNETNEGSEVAKSKKGSKEKETNILGAKGALAAKILARKPVADLVLKDRSDIPKIWDLINNG